jgi:hypothetical protein
MQQRLAAEVESILDPTEEGIDQRLRDRLPAIIRTVHQGLFTMFEEARPSRMAGVQSQSITDTQSSIDSGGESNSAPQFAADEWLSSFWPMDETTFNSPKDHDWQVIPPFD